jgi:hypothetical protein
MEKFENFNWNFCDFLKLFFNQFFMMFSFRIKLKYNSLFLTENRHFFLFLNFPIILQKIQHLDNPKTLN